MDDIRVKLASPAPSAEVFTKRFGGFVSACAEDAFSSKFDNSYIRALIEQPERCVNLHSSSAFRLTNIIYPPRIFQIFLHENLMRAQQIADNQQNTHLPFRI